MRELISADPKYIYIERVITHDFAEEGHPLRQPEPLRGWWRVMPRSLPPHHVRQLLWLKKSLPDYIVDLVVINTGTHAYRRLDGVAVISLALLTA